MLSFRIAWQFIRRKKLQSIIIILTVIIGVGVQFFVSSLGNVLNNMIIEQATTYQLHIQVLNEKNTLLPHKIDDSFMIELMDEFPEIKYIHYFFSNSGLILTSDNRSLPFSLVYLKDIDYQGTFYDFYGVNAQDNIVEPLISSLGNNTIMLDDYFAKQNNIKVGDYITYVRPSYSTVYQVVGTYDLGVFQLSHNNAYVSMEDIIWSSKVKMDYRIQLYNPLDSTKVAKKLNEKLAGTNYVVKTWQDNLPEIEILELAQKSVVLVIQILISVAVFAIVVSILGFLIQQKHKQIGILKAIGIRNKDISLIFIIMTVILSVIGIVIGLIGGTLVMKIYHHYMRYPNGKYRFSYSLTFSNYAVATALVLLAILIASFVSVKKIKKSQIIDLLKL